MATIVQQTNGEKTIYTADEYTQVQQKFNDIYNTQLPGKANQTDMNNVNSQLAHIAYVLTSLKGDGSDESQTVINALNTYDKILIPDGTYYMKNIQLLPGKEVYFGGNVTLKFPSPTTNDRMFIVGSTDGGNIYPVNPSKMIKVIGPFTVDLTGVSQSAAGTQFPAVFVSGASNFEVRNVRGIGYTAGFTVQVTRSYGSEYLVPDNGLIENIRMEGSWSAVAVVAGTRLRINDIYNTTGNAVNLECDADVVTANSTAIQDIEIRNVYTGGGIAVNINAHSAYIDNVRVYGFRASNAELFELVADDTTKYRLTNIVFNDGYGDGKNSVAYGGSSPNDIEVDNLIFRNVNAINYATNGFKVNGAHWYDCSSINSGQSGWQEATANHTNLTKTSYFYKCKANNNNVSNSVNGSGFSPAGVDRVTFINCEASDTRTPALQWYGVQNGYVDTFAINCKFVGNVKKRIGPIDQASYDTKIYEYFPADGSKTAFKTVTQSIGTTQTTVPHNLGRLPTYVGIKPKGNANVWESATADNYNVYLTASVSVTCDVYIG